MKHILSMSGSNQDVPEMINQTFLVRTLIFLLQPGCVIWQILKKKTFNVFCNRYNVSLPAALINDQYQVRIQSTENNSQETLAKLLLETIRLDYNNYFPIRQQQLQGFQGFLFSSLRYPIYISYFKHTNPKKR